MELVSNFQTEVIRTLCLGRTKLTAQGMERLTALKQLECLTFRAIPTLTAECLNHLKKFEHLSSIAFNGCPIAESGLAQLAKVNSLQSLTLHYCAGDLTDAGLKQLASLPLLQDLQLNGCVLDENAVGALKLLASLRTLNVQGTRLAAADIAELHKALPKCAIFWDGGLVLPSAEADRSSKQS